MVNPFFSVALGGGLEGESNTRGYQRKLLMEAFVMNMVDENEGQVWMEEFVPLAWKQHDGKIVPLMDEVEGDEGMFVPNPELTYILNEALHNGYLTFDQQDGCRFDITDKGRSHSELLQGMGGFNARSWVVRDYR